MTEEVRHIYNNTFLSKTHLCGETAKHDWAFQDLHHAYLSIKNGNMPQSPICQECLKEAISVLQGELDD